MNDSQNLLIIKARRNKKFLNERSKLRKLRRIDFCECSIKIEEENRRRSTTIQMKKMFRLEIGTSLVKFET